MMKRRLALVAALPVAMLVAVRFAGLAAGPPALASRKGTG